MQTDPDPDAALKMAISAAGGYSALADLLGIRPPSVHNWKRCPAERVLAVEKATGVAKELLRPDLYRNTTEAAE